MKNCKFRFFGVMLVLSTLGLYSCKEKNLTASVVMMRGNVTFSQENTSIVKPVKLGEILNQGEVIQTGNQSGVILNIKETGSYIEIQSNAIFHISSLKKSNIQLFAEKGNVWVTTEKQPGKKDRYFKVVTPTSVAAVRGTKFYVFNMEGMDCVCHCQGDVEFSRSGSFYKGEHHTDNLVVSKGEKTVLITQEELKKIGLQHRHSMFDKSPVGPENQLTPKELTVFTAFLKKKMAGVK